MAALFGKRGIWIAASLLALGVIAATLTAFAAANRIAGTQLARELTEVTGRRVVYTGEPVIGIFPALSAEIRDVSLHDLKEAGNASPVLEAPVIRLSLSVFSALKGEARITGVMLDRPVFYAMAENGGWQIPLGDNARIAALTNQLSASLPQQQYDDLLAQIGGSGLGTITVNNGTLVLDGAKTDVVSRINGSMSWPSGVRKASLKAEGFWRGEATSLTLNTDDVVMLMAGADAGISAALQSQRLTSRFTGNVRLQPAPYIEGTLFAETDSLLSATQWQGLKTSLNFAQFGLTLSGSLKGDADKWQLDDSLIQMGANKGMGSLTFQPNLSPPLLSGTLDFASLDLAMLSQLFEGGRKADELSRPAIGTDLRISANSAAFGALELNEVAASLQISNQSNALDIHNAAAFGGTLQMALKSQNDVDGNTELRILASDIDTKALGVLGPPLAGLPQTRGSLSAIFRGPNAGSQTFLETAEGTLKIRMGEGIIPGLNANQLVRVLRKGDFFTLKAEAPSVLSFTEINAEAMLSQGTLQFNMLKIGLDKAALTMTGAYAVKDQSIALTGTLDLEAGHPEASNGAESLRVFFGGNRNAPLMSALKFDATKPNPAQE